jgi:hypothetical protein
VFEGRTSAADSEHLTRLSIATSEDKHEQDRAMILRNRRITIRDTVSTLDISEGSAHSMVHDILEFHKVCALWVPKELTEEHMLNRVDIAIVCRSGTAVKATIF